MENNAYINKEDKKNKFGTLALRDDDISRNQLAAFNLVSKQWRNSIASLVNERVMSKCDGQYLVLKNKLDTQPL